jgi:two-component system, OmpR family, sensor histidine kinase PhoQ
VDRVIDSHPLIPEVGGKPYSLRARLLLSATLVLLVFLGLMGFVLDKAFQQSAEQSVEEKLLIHVYGLLAVSDVADDELYLPDELQEPRFNSLGSGLFGLVLDSQGEELWQSPSTLDLQLENANPDLFYTNLTPGKAKFGKIKENENNSLFFLSYKILWQGQADETTPYVYVVLENMSPYNNEIKGFRNSLWGWLLGVVVVLVMVQAAIMNWGLKPLGKLAGDLKAIEDGQQDYLAGEYPAEIDGVTRNLNLLLSSERQQREKVRTTLADLAHSLKTPLAILQSASDADMRETLDEQIPRMNEIVSYQLQRAVTTGSNLIRKPLSVKPVAEKLIEAIKRVYRDKLIKIDSIINDVSFYGDERDLMELLGNILDNACKYSHGYVQLKIGTPENAGDGLLIEVDDDGAGIPENDRVKVLRRGERLDTHEVGQGIGLAVVNEIVARYGGKITLEDSSFGGAKVTIQLP